MITLGKEMKNRIVVDSDDISNFHCTFYFKNEKWHLSDGKKG